MKTYSLLGRVHPKKNSQQMIIAGSRPRIIPSKLYQEFRTAALWELKMQRPTCAVRPYYVRYRIEMKKGEWADPDNLECALNDVLQDANIIGDDRYNLNTHRDVLASCPMWHTYIDIMDKVEWTKLYGEPPETPCEREQAKLRRVAE